jgi:hypothetical protein
MPTRIPRILSRPSAVLGTSRDVRPPSSCLLEFNQPKALSALPNTSTGSKEQRIGCLGSRVFELREVHADDHGDRLAVRELNRPVELSVGCHRYYNANVNADRLAMGSQHGHQELITEGGNNSQGVFKIRIGAIKVSCITLTLPPGTAGTDGIRCGELGLKPGITVHLRTIGFKRLLELTM